MLIQIGFLIFISLIIALVIVAIRMKRGASKDATMIAIEAWSLLFGTLTTVSILEKEAKASIGMIICEIAVAMLLILHIIYYIKKYRKR